MVVALGRLQVSVSIVERGNPDAPTAQAGAGDRIARLHRQTMAQDALAADRRRWTSDTYLRGWWPR